ncbi:uncharacterized protein [Nicotiana sylvestris]|uniref:uncharacterized protein n=1 Tax=Nicotiana sylvestris TaxID=4096 RepID=UPI00388C4722
MLLQITYQDKSTQTDENQESKDIFAILTTLSLQMDSMGKRLQQLESQQHDYKNAELSRSEDLKIPELEGDVGKLQKTHDKVCLPTAAGTSKQVNKKLHTNVNLNNVFDKPFTSKKPKEAIAITPQTTTYANSLHHNKKVYNHITQTYIENIYKIQTFLNLNPRSTTTTDPTQDYISQKLQGYNRLIAQLKTKANLVSSCTLETLSYFTRSRGPPPTHPLSPVKVCCVILKEEGEEALPYRLYNLKLNPAKCTFGVYAGKFLGFIVSRRGIELDPSEVKAIQEFPLPKNKNDVMSFLGRLNYIIWFIAQCTVICEPIFKMLKKDTATK